MEKEKLQDQEDQNLKDENSELTTDKQSAEETEKKEILQSQNLTSKETIFSYSNGFLNGKTGIEYIYDTNFSKKIGLIIGSDITGIQETLKSKCDKIIKIPISDKLESLNAAIATSVIVFEINRQRTN